jgi:hypothetical protein
MKTKKAILILRCPILPYITQVRINRPSVCSFLSDSHTLAESFVEGDNEVRSEVSYLQCATASAAVICGRGTPNWEPVSQRLEAATHFEGRLRRALSVRLFYKVATIAGESRGTFEVDPIDRPLTQKQTSQQFRVFFVPTARRSHLFLAGVSTHGIKAIGNMRYVF